MISEPEHFDSKGKWQEGFLKITHFLIERMHNCIKKKKKKIRTSL